MFLRGSLLLLLPFGFITLGSPFQSTKDDTLTFSGTPNTVKPVALSNASIDTPGDNGFTVHCDGDTYGHNPDIRDCETAKENLTPDSSIWTLGERNTGLPPQTVPLPYRVMGDRGLCYVQPVLIGDHKTAKASINMMRRAAAAIIVRCATDTSSQGGIATNIGMCKARVVTEWSFTPSHIDIRPVFGTCRWRQQSSCNDWNLSTARFLPGITHLVGVMPGDSLLHACRQNTTSVWSTQRPHSHARPPYQDQLRFVSWSIIPHVRFLTSLPLEKRIHNVPPTSSVRVKLKWLRTTTYGRP